MAPKPIPAAERFWPKVDRCAPDECWPWLGATLKDGRGLFWNGLRNVTAPRAIMQILGVNLPPGCYVCHRCDNPPCVNPAHLYVGNATQNAMDTVSRGRHARVGLPGDRNPNAKITDAQVREMRSSGLTAREVAARYDIHLATAQRILRGASRVAS